MGRTHNERKNMKRNRERDPGYRSAILLAAFPTPCSWNELRAVFLSTTWLGRLARASDISAWVV